MSRIQDTRFQESTPHVITRLFREQNRLFGRAVEPFGVSAEQAHLLVLLWREGPLSMTELGRHAALSSGTLSTAVDRMETAGLVRRAPDPNDRRGTRVEALAFSPKKRETLLEALLATEESMMAPLNQKERHLLFSLLSRVLEPLSLSAHRPRRESTTMRDLDDRPKKKPAKRGD